MRVFKNNKIDAVVVAQNPVQAAKILTEEFRELGVVAEIKAKDMAEQSIKKAHVVTMRVDE